MPNHTSDDGRASRFHPRTLLASTLEDGRVWLAVALSIGIVLIGIYYGTHPYPAYGAGLFLAMADQIRLNGYHLPATIPHYTRSGVPFAYPPLAFYITAIFLDVGVDPITFTRIYPGIVTVLCLIPFYYLARTFLESDRAAGLTTVVFVTTPLVLRWHITAGGFIRAPAYLLTLTGLYCGVKLFRTGDRRWLPPAVVLFGLTVLSHPTYTSFFGVSYLLLYVRYDHSLDGLLNGIVVAVGGFLLSAPWWATVISRYGIEPYTSAAATHGGLVSGPQAVVSQIITGIYYRPTPSLVLILTLVGIAILLWRQRVTLSVWFVLGVTVMNEPRFALIPASILAGVTLATLSRGGRSFVGWSSGHRATITRTTRIVTTAIVVFLIVSSGFYVAGSPLGGTDERTSLPQYIDHSDVRAMEWIESKTPSDATFIVLSDTAEWFPFLTDRTMLVSPWGVEWVSPTAYRTQTAQLVHLSACHTERCLTNTLRDYNLHPDYIYVPKGTYRTRFIRQTQQPSMRQSLVASNRYRLVYENEGVMVFQVDQTE